MLDGNEMASDVYDFEIFGVDVIEEALLVIDMAGRAEAEGLEALRVYGESSLLEFEANKGVFDNGVESA